jgi:hypothetical protein
MTARFATNKSKLAACLGISRTLLYEFMRLPDAPAPCADGRWSVSAYRKFIGKKRDSVKASEKEQLQILCLKIKAEREQHELNLARGNIEKEIERKYCDLICRDHEILSSELRRMVQELSPRFEGLSACQIRDLWRSRLDESFRKFRHAFEADDATQPAQSKPKVIVPFRERKAAAAAG